MVRDAGRRTLSKQRILADDQMVVRCDVGSTHPVESPSAQRLRDGLRRAAAEADAVVVSDYAYGVVGRDVLDVLAELHGVTGPVVVDARDITRYRRVRPTVAKPNYREAVRALGLAELEPGEGRLDQLSTRADDLLRIAGAEVVAVTLDGDGALVFERDRPSYRSFADRKRSIRTAGAGDTFTAAFSLALTAGLDTPAAADIASAAAGVVVEADGTGICSAAELRVRLASAHKVAADVDVLEQRIRAVRDRGGRIVFTNGCFDILHRGHITSLNEAKQLGDFLVVGLNSDDGVRRLKGDGRPINRLDDRAEVLAALSCVDAIAPFDEDSPVEIIRRIRPDVFAKGGDYTAETLPEASVVRELGGEVQLLQFVPERSTTGIIRRIQSPSDGPRAG